MSDHSLEVPKPLTAKQRRAQQEEAIALEQAQVWEVYKAEYPARFANLLFQYLNLNHEGFNVVKVDNETYVFQRNHTEETLKVTPPDNFSWGFKYSVESVEREFKKLEEERAEAERQRLFRANALSKLTLEERRALGL
jgi:hypothetical protein